MYSLNCSIIMVTIATTTLMIITASSPTPTGKRAITIIDSLTPVFTPQITITDVLVAAACIQLFETFKNLIEVIRNHWNKWH